MKIKISGFEEWAKNMRLDYSESNPKVECPDCEGDGEIECDCCGHEKHCDVCDGNGKLRFNEASDFKFKYSAFLKTVYADLKKLCIYTGKDFLGAAGEFIKTEQPKKKMHLTSKGELL
tara:strand:+ start:16 stop:369 length:354 start_codon:yes stop_codon:yes gene_type:complete